MNPSIDNDPQFRQRVMRALDQATAKLEAAAYARREPIAVVGIGCRFPGGADSPDAFWERLSSGFDAIVETPADRWDVEKYYDPDVEAEGKIYTNRGGFLDHVDQFDARFFGISPKEAASMDPQQRLLLEVSWEALENAGIVPDELQKTKTGVYIGVTALEYGNLLAQSGHEQINAWFGTGNVANATAGRIAHTLGLQGPAIAVDTACSSSLVAVHLACQGLRQGECDTAIVGGVNLTLSPEAMIALCRARMLAPDGVCKTFDAAADGYVRGEGCGVVLLKRLSDARRDGDNITALVRGSAVNQDGPSSGFTVPNGVAQRKLIQAALDFAGVHASEVDYLEAHGTGTSLGDPIELAAAAAVLAKGRSSDVPLFAGSVKTNIGHLESAAGIAGIIKTVLALKHRVIPQHLHLQNPNPHFDWNGFPIKIPTEATPWPQSGTPIANVSSFGASGTNAHVVLEAAPQEQARAEVPNDSDAMDSQELHLLGLSAKNEHALRQLAEKYVQWLPSDSCSSFAFGEVCRDALELRTHFDYRLCVIASNAEVAVSELSQFLDSGERSQRLSFGVVSQHSHSDGETDQTIDLKADGDGARHRQLTQIAIAFISGREFAPKYPVTGPGNTRLPANRVSLPTYPWQHKRHWFEKTEKKSVAEDWNYEVAWRKSTLQRGAGRHFSHPADVRSSVEQCSGTLTSTQDFRDYWHGVQVVEKRAAQHVARAIAVLRSKFGVQFDEARHDPNALASLCGITDQHQSLFDRVLEIYDEGDALIGSDVAELPPLSELLRLHPEVRIELILLDRCGDQLLDVMQGSCDPLSLLFPDDGESAAHLYESSVGAQAMNRLVQDAVHEVIKSLPEHQALKVLEIGAGTGGTTSSLLPMLPSDRCEYAYTDISPGLLAAAQRKFQDHGFLSYQVLDIEKPPQTQGFDEGQFDLIVAANVLHATKDLAETVEHVRELLAPGGMLLLLEGTPSLRFIDLIFGMTDGWWRFTDRKLRPAHPLIDGPTWEQVLNQHGFSDAASLRPLDADPGILGKQTIVVAKASDACGQQDQGCDSTTNGKIKASGERTTKADTLRSKPKSSWIVLDGESKLGAELVDLLRSEQPDAAIDYVSADSHQWLDEFSAGLQKAKAAREKGSDTQTVPLLQVVYLRGLTDGQNNGIEGVEEACCRDLLELTQAIERSECSVGLSVVTRGAVAAIPEDVVEGISHSPLWGFVRVIATEHPEWAARRIDLDPKADSDHLARQLVDDLLHSDSQESAWRDQCRLHPRLTRCDLPLVDSEWSPRGTWLISGGLGGLGWLTAKMLVRRGLKSLALIGRRAATPSRLLEIEEMRAEGVQVQLHAVDISNRQELETAFLAVKRDQPPVRGIVHAAGIVDDGVLSRMSFTQFQKVLAPKITGARNLHELTADCSLDAFVMFSTASALLGPAAQANHAAANMFLDQFAWSRRSQGLPAQSINWGPWSEVGAAARSDVRHRHATKRIGSIDPVRGIATLERILCSNATQVAVLPVDWREQTELPELFDELAPQLGATTAGQNSTTAGSKGGNSLALQSLQSFPASQRRREMLDHVKACVAEVLGQNRKEIGSRDGFMELGLDSLSSVELRNHLQRSLSLTLPSTLAFDYPTSERLAEYLLEQLSLSTDESNAVSSQMDHQADLAHRVTVKERESIDPQCESMAGQGIAVIGMGCRFPGGVSSPNEFWSLLASGKDAITEVPGDRWDIDAWYSEVPRTRGKMITRCGGFLNEIDRFDSQFFGIAPKEADFVDPQHRLLLETTWEALERGAIAPSTLRGSSTGVFIGISSNEYAERLAEAGSDAINYYWGSGNAGSVAAGRIAFSLDLIGPALAIDTACSSSLVAVHQACNSLGQQECDQAIVGGVNVMLTPTVSINHSQARMLAPDGRCKTFDSSADGFVRSEGCGVVILKRLEDALRDGDVIQAVIRGSATNQDGHTSGITVPNGHSQQAVIEQALNNAGITAADVDLIEAHGTGTSLGDPIELNALEKTFGAARRDRPPLWVGSVKTNIGHAEAAAGIAGLIKAVLSIQHQSIPAHLHLNEPTTKFEWAQSKLDVPRELIDWKSDGPRRAGVSSFGFGGTNAHIVVEQAPEPSAPTKRDTPVEHVLPISAINQDSLRALARRLGDELRDTEHDVAEVAATLGSGRDHFRHRIALVASSIDEAVAELDAVEPNSTPESDGHSTSAVHGTAPADPPQVAFLFTGQGSQFGGMGRELMATEQVFRDSMQRCEELLRPHLDIPLLELVYSDDQASRLNETKYTQPALFAVEYSLTELWKSWGITPDIVIGHSVGEFAAACVAGVFDLATGIELIAARGRLMQALPSGSMAAVFADRQRVIELVQESRLQVELAALNGPSNTVISGTHDSMEKAMAAFDKAGVHFQPLAVSHAFHSKMMEPMLSSFERIASDCEFRSPQCRFISNTTGEVVTRPLTADYWCQHLRQPVEFVAGMESLGKMDCKLFIEIGPRPVLIGMGRQCLADHAIKWLPSLQPGKSDRSQMNRSLSQLYVDGANVDWHAVSRNSRRIELPTYPFQRRRHWAIGEASPSQRASTTSESLDDLSTIIGEPFESASYPGEFVLQGSLEKQHPRYLADHQVFGRSLLPGSFYLSMVQAAALKIWNRPATGGKSLTTDDIEILDICFLEPMCVDHAREAQICVDQSAMTWKIHSRSRKSDSQAAKWTLHATGSLSIRSEKSQGVSNDGSQRNSSLHELRQRVQRQLSTDDFYGEFTDLGVSFGPAFRAVSDVWINDSGNNGSQRSWEILGKLELDQEHSNSTNGLHPIILDAACQLVGALRHSPAASEVERRVYIQSGIDQFRQSCSTFGETSSVKIDTIWAHVELLTVDENELTANVTMFDELGGRVAEMSGLRARVLNGNLAGRSLKPYVVEWRTQSHRDSGHLLGTADSADSLRTQMRVEFGKEVVSDYQNLLAKLEELSPMYIQQAFEQLGYSEALIPASPPEISKLQAQLGVHPKFSRLFSRLLNCLSQAGRVSDSADVQRRMQRLRQRWPSSAEAELLERCGSQLADVLRGVQQPLDLIFPNGDKSAASRVYGESAGVVAMTSLFGSGIRAAIANLPNRDCLRVLEIGAGTGGTTRNVLPNLPPERTSYVFTDISSHFLREAQSKFSDFPFVEYQTLDIERNPLEQGLDVGEFDIVIASNVLHATRNLPVTLKHVRAFLKPLGQLWLLENVLPSRWIELIWGLTDGWWRFDDHLRSDDPLLDTDGWTSALKEHGFSCVSTASVAEGEFGHLARQAIVVAEADGTTVKAQGRMGQTVAADGPDPESAQRWLLVANDERASQSLAKELVASGDDVVRVRAGAHSRQVADDLWEIDTSDRDSYQHLFDDLNRLGSNECEVNLRGVIYLTVPQKEPSTLHPKEMEETTRNSCGGLCRLLQTIQEQGYSQPPRTWLVTSGAQAVRQDDLIHPSVSPLWSVGAVAGLETPHLWGGMIDVDLRDLTEVREGFSWGQIIQELRAPDREDQLAFRDNARYAARVALAEDLSSDLWEPRRQGAYVVTGGLGELGLEIAKWLVDHGARELILVGRSGLSSDRARTCVEELRKGATVAVAAVDVADFDAMSELLASMNNRSPIAGVIHAAGQPGYKSLMAMTDDDFDDVFAAKITGAWTLHLLTQGLDLDCFIMCSSMVSLWGAKGQSHYAAANQFMDALAHYRRSIGATATSVNWGPMLGGMLEDDTAAEVKRMGVASTAMPRSVSHLPTLVGGQQPQIALVDIRWDRFKALYESHRERPLFDQVSPSKSKHAGISNEGSQSAVATATPPAINLHLCTLSAAQRRTKLEDVVLESLREVLGDVDIPDWQTGFFDLGMDSLTAMDFRAQLESQLSLELPSTLAFDYPNVDALTQLLEQSLQEQTASEEAASGSMYTCASVTTPSDGEAPSVRQVTISEIRDLSDADVELMLIEKLMLIETQQH